MVEDFVVASGIGEQWTMTLKRKIRVPVAAMELVAQADVPDVEKFVEETEV